MNVAPEFYSSKHKQLFGFRLFRLALWETVVYVWGMNCKIGTDAEAKKLVAAALTGQLTDVQSKALAELSPEVLSLVLLGRGPTMGNLLRGTRDRTPRRLSLHAALERMRQGRLPLRVMTQGRSPVQ